MFWKKKEEAAGKPYSVTFQPMGKSINSVSGKNAKSVDGEPGSLLGSALSAGIEMDHSCGGMCACATCHVIVKQGLNSCNPMSSDEEDMLDMAPGLTPQSRLACQCIPDGSSDVVVEIPDWKRNR